MKTHVVTGGTDGIGRALGRTWLERDDEVAIVGRSTEKGDAFLAEADRLGASSRAHFVPADLSLVSETRRAIRDLRSRLAKVDTLVLCARHYRATRVRTQEGFESTFALFYLSRFVFSYEMIDLLERTDVPIILNVAGPDGRDAGGIRWDDLGLETEYHGLEALRQSGRLNDLLAVRFGQRRPSRKVRYVLLNPGTVSTSFSGDYDREVGAQVEAMKATATPVEEAIQPILTVVDHPPAEPLTALSIHEPISLERPGFDPDDARRLDVETRSLLAAASGPGGPGEVPAEPVPIGRPPASSVSRTELRRLLDSPVFATVATIQPDGSPHQAIVWVTRDEDDVLFFTAVGSRKERNIRRDPRVSVTVSPQDAPYTYAAIRGTAAFEHARIDELKDELAMKYIGTTYADHIRDTPEAGADRRPVTIVRVTPTSVVDRL